MKRWTYYITCCLAACLFVSAPAAGQTIWWTDLARELTPTSTQPTQAGKTLQLLAPRNGVAHGQIALAKDGPIKSLSVKLSALSLAGETGTTLPDAAVDTAYLTNTDPARPNASAQGPMTTVYSKFIATESPLGVVYLTANVPADARPGRYEGSAEVRVDQETFTVPIVLDVSAYRMPAGKDLDFWISLMQSPAQLSFAYKVKPYSEAHWEKIEASTKLLGQIGHHVLQVPVLWHANCGSGPQMVMFRRDGDGLKPDFTQLERYFKLVAKYCGPQRLMVLGVWGRWIRPGQRHPSLRAMAQSLYLTEIKADGSIGPMKWSSDYQAHAELWKQVYQGVESLAAKYLDVQPGQIVLGFGDDVHPTKQIDAVWKKIAPKSAGWDAWTHNYGGVSGPRPVYYQIVDTAPPENVAALLDVSPLKDPLAKAIQTGQPMYISSCRDIQDENSPAVLYYSIPDLAVGPQKMGRCVGFARIGLDYWPKTMQLVDGRDSETDGFGKESRRSGRAFPGRVARNYRNVLTAQGPDGALPLIHFGALQEGVQAAQARIEIAKAIAAGHADSAGLTQIIELQFTKGARHGLLKQGKAAIGSVSVADLYAGWKPLFQAAAGVSK